MTNTKKLLITSIFAMLPATLSMILLGIISIECMVGSCSISERFLSGNLNNMFLSIIFSSGVISMAIIIASQLILTKYANKIDKLDEAEIEAWEAKKKYEEITQILIKQIK